MRHVGSKKERDKAALLAAIRKFGPLSRVDLHRLTHFRPSTISLLVRELIDERKLREAGASNNPLGRKQTLLTISEDYGFVVGVDFDSEGVTVAAMDLSPKVIGLVREPTDLSGGSEGLVRQLLACTQNALGQSGMNGKSPLGIAVADPGLVDSQRGVSLSSSVLDFWNEVPLRQVFERQFKVPFLLESNTRAKAMAEKVLGSGKEAEEMVYVDYGTGIAAGIVTGGRLLRGHGEAAGEFGHTRVTENGSPCKCGSFGCLEAIASAPALAAKARRAVLEGGGSQVLALAGKPESITGAHVLDAAKRGDRMCGSLVEEMGQYLGLGVANLVNLFNPSIVVLGGMLELAGDPLLEQVIRIVKRQALPHNTGDLQFRFGALGEMAGVLGAGLLFLERIFEVPALKPPRFLVAEPGLLTRSA